MLTLSTNTEGAEGGDPQVPKVGGEEEAHRKLGVRQEHHPEGEAATIGPWRLQGCINLHSQVAQHNSQRILASLNLKVNI